jgi:hypothetical protein
MTVRLPIVHTVLLSELADRHGVSVNRELGAAISEYLARHADELAAAR